MNQNMAVRIVCATIAATAFGSLGARASTEYNFSELFAKQSLGNTIVIQIPSDGLLVFDKDGPFTTNGKVLVIYAANAVVRANTTINSFPPTSSIAPPPGRPATPPDQTGLEGAGQKGAIGSIGNPGRGCRQFVLGIDTISADAGKTLTLVAFGEKGGPGQQGGNGGRGGPGRSGGDAGELPCSHPCPDSGTRGGPGGPAGAGGQGGQGGFGGAVFLSTPLFKMYTSGNQTLTVRIDGGSGGDPGAVGLGGLGGPGGARGSGSHTCVCSNPPPPGPDGYGGGGPVDTTPQSQSGQKGSVAIYNP